MKNFFRKNKKTLVIFSVLLVALISALILVKQNQDLREDASGLGCGGADNARDCATRCSPPKGKNNISYQCAYRKNGCKETSKECGGSGSMYYCPVGLNCQLESTLKEEGKVMIGGAPCYSNTEGGPDKMWCCPPGKNYDENYVCR